FAGRGPLSLVALRFVFFFVSLINKKGGRGAPAMIAFVKDIMIYVFVVAAIIIIPAKLGGYGAIFDAAADAFAKKGGATGLTLKPAQIVPYITLAIGSAMALFIYPHSLTGILSASSSDTIKPNAIAVPAYSLVLVLIGYWGSWVMPPALSCPTRKMWCRSCFSRCFPTGL